MYNHLYLYGDEPHPSMRQIPIDWSFIVMGIRPMRMSENSPQTSETAAIMPGGEGCIVGRQVIVLSRRSLTNSNGNEVFDKITVALWFYNLLSYFLLYRHGTDGWHVNMSLQVSSSRRRQRSKISQLIFYAYQLSQSPNEFNTIL